MRLRQHFYLLLLAISKNCQFPTNSVRMHRLWHQNLTLELFEGDKENAINWFNSPNTLLFGESPFEVCIRGEGKLLIKWLKDRLGKEDTIEKENNYLPRTNV